MCLFIKQSTLNESLHDDKLLGWTIQITYFLSGNQAISWLHFFLEYMTVVLMHHLSHVSIMDHSTIGLFSTICNSRLDIWNVLNFLDVSLLDDARRDQA